MNKRDTMKYTCSLVHAILLSISCLCLIAPATTAFLLQSPNKVIALTNTELKMGFFDGIAKAFSNEEVSRFLIPVCHS